MISVSSSQFNYQYGTHIHFPYSIAMLVTYLKSDYNIKKNFSFNKTAVFRNRVDDYIDECKNTDILLCSCYVWNWEITNYLAQEVHKINPSCLIIFGGPHVPDDTTNFFETHDYVDILVHGEGELIIKNIFDAYINNKNYSTIKGITTKEFKNLPEERIQDFSILPSPFLTNTIWELVEQVDGIRWDVSWETNRGCPYLCTFCDWGSSTFTKLRKFSDDRLFKEISWFAENKLSYIFCCDANFGIYFDRDLEIAKKIKESSLKTSYPGTFFVNWAKNSSEKIIPIAKELKLGGLLTGVTLSVQSLDENTLNIIKRANIKFDKFSILADQFRSNDLPTYSEIIRGLPGETLETFKEGLENMIGESNIETIYVYHCGVLPNAPMNIPEYKKKYEIKTIRSPIYLRHTSIHERTMEEYEYIVISTSSFTFHELKEMYLYSWLILSFQSLGLLEYISKYYNKLHSISFIDFYEDLLDFCRQTESLFSEEYKKVFSYMNIGYEGKGWNHYDQNLGDIYWPIEEATWLRLISKTSQLIPDITSFLNYFEKKHNLKTSHIVLDDLINFQIFLLTDQNNIEIKSRNFKFNWVDFFLNISELEQTQKKYFYKNQIVEDDYVEWCKQVIWYGRQSGKYKIDLHMVQEEISDPPQLITKL